jgi:carbon starvation protein
MEKAKYAWMTAVPGIFMSFVCLYAGYLNITDNYLPKGLYFLTVLSVIIMALMVVVFVTAFRKWHELLQVTKPVVDKYGDGVLELVEE